MDSNQTIADIEYSILESLKFLKSRYPEIYNQLPEKPFRQGNQQFLAHVIYRLYNADPKMAKYFNNLFTEEVKDEYKDRVKNIDALYIQALEKAFQIVEQYKNFLDIKPGGGWIQVNPKIRVNITRRMYLNCIPGQIHTVVNELVKLMMLGKAVPAIIFKFPDWRKADRSMLIRSDKVVVYYGDDPVTNEILRDWAGTMAKFFRESKPLFTKGERNGVAFAYEPSPDQHDYVKEETGKETSFGGFMSLIIARYIYAWCLTNKKIPAAREAKRIAIEIFEDKFRDQHNLNL